MRSGRAEERQVAEGVDIPLLQIFPEMRGYFHRCFIRSKRRWILFAASLLHLQISLTERIRTDRKIVTGKLIAIPQAVLNPVDLGTSQYGTGAAE